MEKEIRKYRDHLIISGNALLAFGVWSLLRVFVLKASDKTVFETIADNLGREYGIDAAIIDIITILIYIIIEFAFRIYVRRSAIKESKGIRTSIAYLIISAIYILDSLFFYISYLSGILVDNSEINVYSMVIIDITTIIALVIIIAASVKLRRIRCSQESSGEENAD